MKHRTANQRLLVGLLIGVLIGAIFALYGLELLPGGYEVGAVIMIGAFFIVAILLLIAVSFRDRIFKTIFGNIDDAEKLVSSSQELTNSLSIFVSDILTRPFPKEQQDNARQIAPRIVNFLIWTRIRRWWLGWLLTIFIAIGGLATTVLLVNQNKLLELQNRKLDTQSGLMDAERKSAQIVFLTDVLDNLSIEIQSEKNKGKNDSTGYSLSGSMIGRIAVTSYGFQPYEFLIGRRLTDQSFSFERAQLLSALVYSQIDSLSMLNINMKSTFAQSYFDGVSFENKILSKAKLSESYFWNVNLKGAILLETNLRWAILNIVDFTKADLRGADFWGADFSGANFTSSDLRGTKFHSAKLQLCDFKDAKLDGAYFGGVTFDKFKNLTKKQLLTVKSLNECKNLDPKWVKELKDQKPCLFEPEGCD